jgi:hypothetical protein
MYKIVYNQTRNSYTVLQFSFASGKDKEIFYTTDFDSLFNYVTANLSVDKMELNSAIDTMDRLNHNVIEFGVNKKLVLTYNLDH